MTARKGLSASKEKEKTGEMKRSAFVLSRERRGGGSEKAAVGGASLHRRGRKRKWLLAQGGRAFLYYVIR